MHDTKKILYIVFVCYNCGEDIVKVIESIKNGDYLTDKLKIIVVDNDSHDDSLLLLEQVKGVDLELIKSVDNLGFGAGCNLAFNIIPDNGYVLLLNPDIHIENNTISHLMRYAEETPQARLWGGRELNDKKCGLREPSLKSVFSWSFFGDFFLQKIGLPIPEAYSLAELEQDQRVDVVCGFCLLIETSLLKQLNGFDERFFMYSEEVDLCRRAREAGAVPMINPDITIIHELSKTITSENKLDFLYGSKLKYCRKHWSYYKFLLARVSIFTGSALRCLAYCIKGLYSPKSKQESVLWYRVLKKQLAWKF